MQQTREGLPQRIAASGDGARGGLRQSPTTKLLRSWKGKLVVVGLLQNVNREEGANAEVEVKLLDWDRWNLIVENGSKGLVLLPKHSVLYMHEAPIQSL